MDANPRLAGELMIASFPNCIGVTITRTHAEFGAWKTEQGIGLGSREGAVLRAYGPPTDRSWIYRDDPAVAYNPKLLPVPDLHVPVEQLRYAPPNVMRGSIFGIYRGRVVWIMLTDEG